MYNLIQKRRGKETVVMTDTLSKVNDRMKTLRASHRKGIKGSKVEYRVEKTEETIKYQKAPHDYYIAGGGKHPNQPKRV